MATLVFILPDGTTDSSNEAVTVSITDTATQLSTLPRYITWSSGKMKTTVKKSGGLGAMPLSMKIGDIVVKTVSNGISTSPAKESIFDFEPTTTVDNVAMKNLIILTGINYSIPTLSWVFGEKSTVNKTYTYSNTSLEIVYTNPKFTINGLSNNPNWGNINGTGEIEITEKSQQKTLVLTAVSADNCRFLEWADGVTTPTRTITLSESELTSPNTQKTYTALFAPKELYVGTKNVTAAYVGTKKAKVYRGTTRIL